MVSSSQTLSGPSMGTRSGKEATSAVIFLHGYGADGDDLISLGSFFGEGLPDTAFYSPDAPEPCEMLPFGRQWFSLAQYDPEMMRRSPETMGPVYQALHKGAIAAAPILNNFIDEILAKHNFSASQLALIGFSQGTMMALHVGMRRTAQLAAVVGFSGGLVGANVLADEIVTRPPTILIHGDSDDVVPPEASAYAEQTLRANGVEVTSHLRPHLAHGIDPQGAAIAREFLAGILNKA